MACCCSSSLVAPNANLSHSSSSSSSFLLSSSSSISSERRRRRRSSSSSSSLGISRLHLTVNIKSLPLLLRAVSEAQESAPISSPSSSAAAAAAAAAASYERRLYVGNIPREVTDEELTRLFQEHGPVEKAQVMYDKYSGRSRRFAFVTMSTIEAANATIEKMNDSEIGGRKIKVNITEKPLEGIDVSKAKAEESSFIDNPYKVYVGNLAKTVTSDMLKEVFSAKGKVLSSKISRIPGTSKSSGFGFVSFSSEEDVEAAISAFNNSFLERQRIRVNKA